MTPALPLYYLLRQPDAAVNGKPPMLILLHGVGSHEGDLFGLAPELDSRFLILSARAPIPLAHGGYGWYPVQFTQNGPIIDPETAQAGQQKLLEFIREAKAAFDVERVYLMGFSQGAIMSVNTLLTEPELISGVVAMSGRLLPDLKPTWVDDPARLKDFPVIVVHGLYDQVLSINDGRAIRDHLGTLPVNLTYKEYGMMHNISTESLADIQTWLAAQLNGAA